MTADKGHTVSAITAARDDSAMSVARRLLYGGDDDFIIDTVADRRIDTGATSGAMRLRGLLDGFGPAGNTLAPSASTTTQTDAVEEPPVSRAGALYHQF